MRKAFLYNLFFICSTLAFSMLPVKAQNPTAFDDEKPAPQTGQPKRPNLMRELELTPAQIREVRKINQEIKAERQAAQQRLKAARQAFETAIYSGRNNNDAEVQMRVRELQAARLDVLQNRVSYEQSLKRILTPQQLSKFRMLQEEYNQAKATNPNAGQNRRQNENLTPRQQRRLNRLENRQRQQRRP